MSAGRKGDERVSTVSLQRRLTYVWGGLAFAVVVGFLLAVAATLPTALGMVFLSESVNKISVPSVEFMKSLDKERALSHQYRIRGDHNTLRALYERREETDRVLQQTRAEVDAQWVLRVAPPAKPIHDAIGNFLQSAAILPRERQQVDDRRLSEDQIFGAYNSIIDSGEHLYEVQSRVAPDYLAGQGGMEATRYFQHYDRQSQAATIVSNALETRTLDHDHYIRFVGLVQVYRQGMEMPPPAVDTPDPIIGPDIRREIARVTNSPEYRRLTQLEDQLIAQGPWDQAAQGGRDARLVTPNPQEWAQLSGKISADVSKVAVLQSLYSTENAERRAWDSLGGLLILFGIALAVTVLGFWQSVRHTRIVRRRFGHLQEYMRAVSSEALPEISARISDGELPENAAAELPEADFGTDEIAQVKSTFDGVVEAAVDSFVSQAKAQTGMKSVLVKMARRNTIPIKRGIDSVDGLLSIDDLPESALDYIFKIDESLTNIRRQNENVLVLGGESPGRQWNRPIPLLDVLRASGQETADHSRLHYEQVPNNVAIVPSAVADVMHLLAELIENALAFSQDRVWVQAVPRQIGTVIRVEDQGAMGMSDVAIRQANDLFAGRSQFDLRTLENTDSKGHFVVATLARKHGILVELEAVYVGGIRAVVSIPERLIHRTGTEQGGDFARGTESGRAAEPRRTRGNVLGTENSENGISGNAITETDAADLATTATNGTPVRRENDPRAGLPSRGDIGRHRDDLFSWAQPSGEQPAKSGRFGPGDPTSRARSAMKSSMTWQGNLPDEDVETSSSGTSTSASGSAGKAADTTGSTVGAGGGRAPLPRRNRGQNMDAKLHQEPSSGAPNTVAQPSDRSLEETARLINDAWRRKPTDS